VVIFLPSSVSEEPAGATPAPPDFTITFAVIREPVAMPVVEDAYRMLPDVNDVGYAIVEKMGFAPPCPIKGMLAAPCAVQPGAEPSAPPRSTPYCVGAAPLPKVVDESAYSIPPYVNDEG
jgi:hypothetical protein